jgi:two-component system chemotaxis response regulator CheB
MTAAKKSRHDIVVIGASAGGVEALSRLAADLPPVEAAIFAVVHTGPNAGLLAGVIGRHSAWPVQYAEDELEIEPGRIYVAPPDRHLQLEKERMRLTRGPLENRHRPAVDVLFRSASQALGGRVVAVVLSGYLDDGAAGLIAVKRRGGATIAQDPTDAVAAGMPEAAIATGVVDFVVSLKEMPGLIASLVEAEVVQAPVPIEEGKPVESTGKPSAYTCPQCHGTLWEIEDGGLLRFACRVGHAFSAESMLEDQGDVTERALWAAVRSLEERADLAGRMMHRSQRRGHELAEQLFRERMREARHHSETLRALLTGSQREEPKERRDSEVKSA